MLTFMVTWPDFFCSKRQCDILVLSNPISQNVIPSVSAVNESHVSIFPVVALTPQFLQELSLHMQTLAI